MTVIQYPPTITTVFDADAQDLRVPTGALEFGDHAQLAVVRLATRDKTCPSGHEAGRTRPAGQHLSIGPISVIVARGGVGTYLGFRVQCRRGGCGWTSGELAVRLRSL